MKWQHFTLGINREINLFSIFLNHFFKELLFYWKQKKTRDSNYQHLWHFIYGKTINDVLPFFSGLSGLFFWRKWRHRPVSPTVVRAHCSFVIFAPWILLLGFFFFFIFFMVLFSFIIVSVHKLELNQALVNAIGKNFRVIIRNLWKRANIVLTFVE